MHERCANIQLIHLWAFVVNEIIEIIEVIKIYKILGFAWFNSFDLSFTLSPLKITSNKCRTILVWHAFVKYWPRCNLLINYFFILSKFKIKYLCMYPRTYTGGGPGPLPTHLGMAPPPQQICVVQKIFIWNLYPPKNIYIYENKKISKNAEKSYLI